MAEISENQYIYEGFVYSIPSQKDIEMLKCYNETSFDNPEVLLEA